MLRLFSKVRFLKFEDSTDRIQVAILDFDFAGEAAELRRLVKEARDTIHDPMECGVDSLGKRHDAAVYCHNEAFDSILGETYCTVKQASDLEEQRHHIQWLPQMLEHFWQHGTNDQGKAFLVLARFVYEYE